MFAECRDSAIAAENFKFHLAKVQRYLYCKKSKKILRAIIFRQLYNNVGLITLTGT